MAIRYIPTDTDGVDVDINDDLWILREGLVLSNTTDAFDFLAFAGGEFIVEGSVYSQADAIDSDAGSFGNTVYVSSTGLVWGASDGIEMSGDSHKVTNLGEVHGASDRGIQIIGNSGEVFNSGYVYGSSDGVSLEGDGTIFTNTGTITSAFDGLNIDGTGNELSNSGLISGNRNGVEFNTVALETNTLLNSGTIQTLDAGGTAIQGDFGDETIINTGTIIGDVLLGDGDDTYDGTGGSLIGEVDGGIGEDRISGGTQDDLFDGGGGADVLRGGAGDDELYGGGRRDTVIGGLGDDVMEGNGGADKLNGRAGDDVLAGGKGADTFIFGLNAGHDIITDFDDGKDQIDLSAYGANFNAVNGAISNSGGNAYIDLSALGGDGTIVVAGAAGDLDASDFIL